MKKGLILLLIVVIIVAVAAFFIVNNNKNSNQQEENKTTLSENENSKENSSDLNENNNALNNENDDAYGNSTIYRISIVDKEDYDLYYTSFETEKIFADSINIEENNGKVTILLSETDLNDYLIGDSSVEYEKEYNVENAGNVKEIFMGEVGQDWDYPLVFLIQEDGTVRGVDIEEGYKTGNFVAKTISGLDNLEKFEQVSVSKPDDSGYNSVVAITKDEEIFEILPNN